jgi:radical SAM-linked protein
VRSTRRTVVRLCTCGDCDIMRLRIRFEKSDAVRFCSHKDVVRIFQRCFTAAAIPVCYSLGFHPHMRMSFGPPIKTGWYGLDEYMDVCLEKPVGMFLERIHEHLPGGLTVRGYGQITDDRVPKLANDICAAAYVVGIRTEDTEPGGAYHVPSLDKAKQVIKEQFAGAETSGGILPEVVDADVTAATDGVRIEYTTTMLSGRVVPPHDVVSAAFADPEDLPMPIRVERTAQFVCRNGEYLSPLDQRVIQGQT